MVYAARLTEHTGPRLVREEGPGWKPETSDPEDEVFLLGERCAETYMQADALHYEAMTLLAEFDRRRGWEDTPFSSTAEWLAWRIGITLGPARERVRTARALESLPATRQAMKHGELSFAKVRALTRVATEATESELLEFARAGSAANLERLVRGWKSMDRASEVDAEELRYRSRSLSVFRDADGMVVVKGRLSPEEGSLLMRAMEAAEDALFRSDEGDDRHDRADRRDREDRDERDDADLPQRRADALGLLAERALAAGLGETAPVSGSTAERYQVLLHVDADTLSEDGEPGQSELADGTRVSAETSRRVACDAGVVRIAHRSDGSILNVGRRTRTIPPSVRRALEARDRGCRFPGCGLRFTDAHHVKHWADGGETSLRNLVLLCRRHHRAVHEGRFTVCSDRDGRVVFFTPAGKALAAAPPTPQRPVEVRRPLDESVRAHRPSHQNGAARWTRDSEIPWEIEALAWEALEEETGPATRRRSRG